MTTEHRTDAPTLEAYDELLRRMTELRLQVHNGMAGAALSSAQVHLEMSRSFWLADKNGK